MSCGATLATRCASCGTENPPGAKFCIECGSDLGAASRPAAGAPATADRGAPAGPARPDLAPPGVTAALPEERRKATVLFADLSGYTAVAERMDPETVKSMVDRALQRLGQEVDRYGGRVDKFIGDNVMAVFGAPVAHEDDPERAVRAGLAMQRAMDEINADIADIADASFLLRVGINSGEVLAGQVGRDYTVMGDPVNVAARLQAAARPGSVTVGEITHRLTSGAIEYEELAPLELKGKSEPVPAWEAVRVTVATPTRIARASTPLIGREDEATQLLSLFDQVRREERPHLITVIGQAGVGKSRLLRELATRVSETPGQPLMRVGHCPAYGTALAYWALGEIIRGQFEIVDTDDSELAWGKLRRGAESLLSEEVTDEPPERVAALLARPLGNRGAGGGRGWPGPRFRGPAGHARPDLLRGALPGGGRVPPEAAGAGDRGHPLGRRGDAGPDRVSRPLGAGPAAARLPGAGRAARPPARLGRRAAQRDHDRARPARLRSARTSWSGRCSAKTAATATASCCARSPSAPAATRCSPRRW